LADLTHEQILEYLNGIEHELDPSLKKDKNDLNLMTKTQSNVFPFRERYLEHVVSLGENSDRY
jgi:hypothetical protein